MSVIQLEGLRRANKGVKHAPLHRSSVLCKTIDLDCHKKKLYCLISSVDKTLIDSDSNVDRLIALVNRLDLSTKGFIIVNHDVANQLLQ